MVEKRRDSVEENYFLKMSSDEIRRAITDLPQGDPAKCEGLIRNINDQISALQDAKEKEKLYNELKAVGCLGLHEDLKKMMERKGLRMEGLDLVVKYLTNVPELAQYLYVSSKEVVEDAGLEIVRRRLGPDLEVLGGLGAAGIDVTKEWAKKLCEKAPSLQALPRLRLRVLEDCCQGADDGEMAEVHCLVEFAESHRKQLSAIPQDEKLVKQNEATKGVDEEKLKKAKELMNEANAMAKDQSEAAKKTVNEKIAVIMSKLELPSDWFKADKAQPEQLFQQLDQIIQQCSNVVETGETYKSEVEVITKASAGRALCGIYHSEYEAPKPAGRPLLQVPTNVKLTNPNSAQEINYMKFSAKGAATNYVRTVESSSTNIGFGVTGFYGLFVGEVKGAHGSERQSQADHSIKTSTTNASVLQYIRTAKKTFQLDRDKIRLSLTARKMARSIVQDKKASAVEQEKSARLFLERYGSHFPAGVQTLGGVFFSIADAESKSTTEASKLTEAAVGHLKAQMSVGFSQRSIRNWRKCYC
ncbi:hypothetical protein OS493_040430 [Desmophyllum pertusum]|uniref:MACPF domain-containing protein n=1 Tax=Desmophyllum pertusum TaxID=174260 RepID=A0A9W9Z5E4_9CNID|nr:hypothetical protein OS493_040430 [Desmophyllum pertusum]